jgi:rod shape-determining protein MreC
LLIGQLALDPNGRLRVRLSADYERLEFLRVLRDYGTLQISDPGELVIPQDLVIQAPSDIDAPKDDADG